MKRTFGETNVALSPITLGSMRFLPNKISSVDEGVSLLAYLYDHGITSYHTSFEYEAHAYFCEVFRQFKARCSVVNDTHIVKLASPHFEETDFSLSNLEQKVDEQLKMLQIEQIDIVQWLFRQKNNVDDVRIPRLRESALAIQEGFERLVKKGKVRAFASFPYTMTFAEVVQDYGLVSGFVDYLNLLELDWAKAFQEVGASHRGFVSIRPLFAGKVLDFLSINQDMFKQIRRDIAQHCCLNENDIDTDFAGLAYPLLSTRVSSTIVSISSYEHAKKAISVQSHVHANDELFNQITQQLAYFAVLNAEIV
jgi:aryl-alcohol dehydrogenase-like predicted oxidoreductase